MKGGGEKTKDDEMMHLNELLMKGERITDDYHDTTIGYSQPRMIYEGPILEMNMKRERIRKRLLN